MRNQLTSQGQKGEKQNHPFKDANFHELLELEKIINVPGPTSPLTCGGTQGSQMSGFFPRLNNDCEAV